MTRDDDQSGSIRQTFGELVRQARHERLHVTQQEMAAAAGISMNTLWEMERGYPNRWRPSTFHRLYAVLREHLSTAEVEELDRAWSDAREAARSNR